MAKKIETVCGYSCSDCNHYEHECPGCIESRGKPFWNAFVGIDGCPVYVCCVTERRLPHCGKCPELMCERFTRYKNPEESEEAQASHRVAMKQELLGRP